MKLKQYMIKHIDEFRKNINVPGTTAENMPGIEIYRDENYPQTF